MTIKLHLTGMEFDVEQGEALTFRQRGEDGNGIEGQMNWEDIQPDLMAALVDLEETSRAKGRRILDLIPAEEWAYVTPFLAAGMEVPPHGCRDDQ